MVKATYLNVQVVFRLRMLADMMFPYPNLEIRMSPGALWSSLATPKTISDVNVYMWNVIYMFTLIYVIEKNINNVISCNIYMSYKYI